MDQRPDDVLDQPLVVINLGLKAFAESLEQQGVEVVQVDWIPPAGGDAEMLDLLDELLWMVRTSSEARPRRRPPRAQAARIINRAPQ